MGHTKATYYLDLLASYSVLICGVLACGLLTDELVRSRKGWRRAAIAVIFSIGFFAALQWSTGYSLAFKFGSLAVYFFAILAYFFAMIVMASGRRRPRRWNQVAAGIGITAPIVAAASQFVGILLASFLIVGLEAKSRLFAGRMSPTLSYHIDEKWTLGPSTSYEYVIVRNPSFLPFVEKKLQQDNLPCTGKLQSVMIQLSRDKRLLFLSCREEGGPIQTAQLPVIGGPEIDPLE